MVAVARIVDSLGVTKAAFADNTIGYLTDYSLSEEASPLAPGDTSGATAQFSVTAVAGVRAHRAVGQSISLDLDTGETVIGTITETQESKSIGIATFTADSLLNRVNAEVTAKTRVSLGSGFDIEQATFNLFSYYMGLVGILSANNDVLVDEIMWHEWSTPGFKGNLWSNLKELCAARGYQIYSTGDDVGFTTPGKIDLVLNAPVGTSLRTDITQRAKTILLSNYNHRRLTSWGDQVIWRADQVFSVAAGEVQEQIISIEGSLAAVAAPTPVSGMNLSSFVGQYVVTGNDGYVVAPSYWLAQGGNIAVKLGENPNELVVTITGARDTTRAPYTITEGSDRPALWVTGSGILYDKEVITLHTGDDTAPTESVEIDNVYIGSRAQAFSRGVLTAQQYSGPQQVLSLQGTPDFTLTRRAYTRYAPAPNGLRDPQASCGRKSGYVEGWGTFKGGSLIYAPGLGMRLKVTITVPNAIDILHSVPVAALGGLFSQEQLDQNRQWLRAVSPNIVCSASFRLTRISGTQRMRAVITWYNSNFVFAAQSLGTVGTFTTGVETTISVNSTSPTGSSLYYAVISLITNDNTAVDYTISGAQLTIGSTATVVTAYQSMPAIEITSVFGSLAGAILAFEDNKYRVLTAEYSPDSVDLTLARYVTFADFDGKWAGKTFADFDAFINTDMTFGQLSVEPLRAP